ncbi:hypothetical protein AB0H43_07250, partial [Hamadaea sp. NPDC050747]|uniref:hypothetical protein n=1 Tax=Hamadaea sp. NPDC050747 TaxID=3155789 RepID=UPI0033C90C8C
AIPSPRRLGAGSGFSVESWPKIRPRTLIQRGRPFWPSSGPERGQDLFHDGRKFAAQPITGDVNDQPAGERLPIQSSAVARQV